MDEDGKKPLEAFDYSGAHEKTDPKEIALVKKLDWYIMPMLWIMYWLNYLDRNAIALARLDDLEEDLNLTSTQYQTCVSILFVGYSKSSKSSLVNYVDISLVLGQVPSNMLLTRLRPSWYMAGFMALWAIVSALTALSTNFTGLLLTRFFLGVVSFNQPICDSSILTYPSRQKPLIILEHFISCPSSTTAKRSLLVFQSSTPAISLPPLLLDSSQPAYSTA